MDSILKISSHSFHRLSIVQDEKRYLVLKQFSGDTTRALKCIQKQKTFQPLLAEGLHISAAEVIRIEQKLDELELFMPYIHGINAAGFALYGTKAVAYELQTTLNQLIITEMANSKIQQIPGYVFVNKIEEILNKLNSGILKSCIIQILDYIGQERDKFLEIPIGSCHGDLTLSNILLIRKKGIFLIDFLDSPIESPLQDVAKLIQDFIFGWSFRYEKNGLQLKGQILSEVAMPSIVQMLLIQYKKQLSWFILLTLARIAPYVQDEITHNWLINALKTALRRFT
ncbi:MAG: phosphotransferase [Burkholderiales bacterium]|nr:phosphotransferase [Burkholderiales bacterium]